MSDTPLLTDHGALILHRNRARRRPALFLHEEALTDVQDRLSLVNKSFHAPAIVTPYPEVWTDAFPDAHLIPDNDVLDLTEGTHDLIIHAMALHWANDPVGQLIQCRRALKPDGLLLVIALGGQTLHELRAALGQAEIEVTGGLSPRIAPMGEIRDLGGLLQRAGFALPVADATPVTASYVNAFHLMHDLRKMGENNALAQRIKHPTRRNVLTEAACIYADNFRNAENRVDATFEFITLTGWAPAENQPKALRPGSAK